MRAKIFLIGFSAVLFSCSLLGSNQVVSLNPTDTSEQPVATRRIEEPLTEQPTQEEALPPTEEEPTSESDPTSQVENVEKPDHAVKLIFIHHSSGENWLADENGGLGLALMQNNYFVSDTNYDWGPEDPLLGGPIGSFTDTGNWWNWFLGPSSAKILKALYTESEQHASYARLDENLGGENEIVLFKSCFPNSAMDGSPTDPPTMGENPLFGKDSGSGYQTVANAKGVYIALLGYFRQHPEKLFVAITAPPLLASDTSPEQAANARAFNRWLVEEWLADYPLKNVAVFDFYNVLTSNGGDPNTNDLGAEEGNHHRVRNGQIEYAASGDDTSAYAENGDSHPTSAGNQKATGEFIDLLNLLYQRWIAAR